MSEDISGLILKIKYFSTFAPTTILIAVIGVAYLLFQFFNLVLNTGFLSLFNVLSFFIRFSILNGLNHGFTRRKNLQCHIVAKNGLPHKLCLGCFAGPYSCRYFLSGVMLLTMVGSLT